MVTDATPRLRILMLIRSLERGGAEHQLSVLARGLQARGHRVSVAVFYPGGALTDELLAAGVEVHSLDKRGRWDLPGFLLRLHRCLRRTRPQLLHGYLTVPNLLCVLLGAWRPGLAVVWGIRASDMRARHYDWLAGLGRWLECRLAWLADLCISNSEAGRRHAIAGGFPASRLRVVANGIDTWRFRPDPAAGAAQRQRWGVATTATLIGLVGRLDPVKDHPTFLRMAAALRVRHPDLRFVCVGDGSADYQQWLHAEAVRLGLGETLIWAGECTTMPTVYNALDLLVSSSVSEGFANVIGEAMACEVPCVVTAVGDGAIIVGDTGSVVPSANPRTLAGACEALLALSVAQRRQQGRRARQRVSRLYSVERLVTDTERLLGCLVSQRRISATLDQPPATDS